jgi:hypothetical protein
MRARRARARAAGVSNAQLTLTLSLSHEMGEGTRIEIEKLRPFSRLWEKDRMRESRSITALAPA